MNWRNRSTSLFQMLGIATSLAWSNAHTASRRRCLSIRGTLEIAVLTSQDAADPPLRYPACNLSVEPSSTTGTNADSFENVWEYLRQNQLSLRVWPGFEAIVETCCQDWNALMAMPERIASITRREWAKSVTA